MLTTTKEPAAMDEAELEAHIKSCGQLMVDEHMAGNREAALGWLQAQQEAIRARRPEVVARMEQELMQRIHEPCYFVSKAEEDLPALLRRQAA